MNMKIRIIAALLAAGALVTGCTTPPAYESQKTAEDQCRLFRGYLSTQPYVQVMEACTRHLGEAYCRECLAR